MNKKAYFKKSSLYFTSWTSIFVLEKLKYTYINFNPAKKLTYLLENHSIQASISSNIKKLIKFYKQNIYPKKQKEIRIYEKKAITGKKIIKLSVKNSIIDLNEKLISLFKD